MQHYFLGHLHTDDLRSYVALQQGALSLCAKAWVYFLFDWLLDQSYCGVWRVLAHPIRLRLDVNCIPYIQCSDQSPLQ